MWKSIFELTKRLLLLAENTDRNRDDIKELQRQMKEMTAAFERLAYEVRRVSERDDHERGKVILRLENDLRDAYPPVKTILKTKANSTFSPD